MFADQLVLLSTLLYCKGISDCEITPAFNFQYTQQQPVRAAGSIPLPAKLPLISASPELQRHLEVIIQQSVA